VEGAGLGGHARIQRPERSARINPDGTAAARRRRCYRPLWSASRPRDVGVNPSDSTD